MSTRKWRAGPGVWTLLPVLVALSTCDAGAEVPTIAWIDQFGTPTMEYVSGVSAYGGRVYVAGVTAGALPGQTSQGGRDCFVRAYDLSGNHLWTRQFGSSAPAGNYDDTAIAIEAGPTGVYVCGRLHGPLPGQPWWGGTLDCFLRKYDHDGIHQWTDHFGSYGFDSANCMALGPDAVYTAGQCGGLLPGSSTYGGIFVRKVSFEGTVHWTRQNGSAWEAAYGMFVDDGGIYLTGRAAYGYRWMVLIQKHDLAGGLVWRSVLGTPPVSDQGQGITADSSGIYIGGFTQSSLVGFQNAGGMDPFVCKYSHAGSLLWLDQFGTSAPEEWAAVRLEGDTLYAYATVGGSVGGQSHLGGTDGVIRRYTLSGGLQDTMQLGTAGDDLLRLDVQEGTMFIAGYTTGTFPGETALGDRDAFAGMLLSADCTMQGLVDDVLLAGLPHGLERALLAKLQAAEEAFARGSTGAGNNQLAAFVNQCQAQAGNHLPAGMIQQLVATAHCLLR